MGALFNKFNIEPVKGKEITIGEYFPEVFVSDQDQVFCYSGICLLDDVRRKGTIFMTPHELVGKHSTTQTVSNRIKGLYRIVSGCIVFEEYVDGEIWGDKLFKKIPVGVKFPFPDIYYAVLSDHFEDQELTRAVFGLTCEELTSLIKAYAIAVGCCHEYSRYPKLTRSSSYSHFCDLTGLWIPQKFPYIAFDESDYDFSHVSLWGFYRHLQLLTGCHEKSTFSRLLMKCGITETLLERIFRIGHGIFYQAKVTQGSCFK
jgi:hypothetical protein